MAPELFQNVLSVLSFYNLESWNLRYVIRLASFKQNMSLEHNSVVGHACKNKLQIK
jgi:hypothetical protein